MKLYFAYGSNMSAAQMTERCPAHQKIGTARLPGYRWIISTRGYANIVRADDEEVEGVLYAINQKNALGSMPRIALS
jgi:gamma-glutamylcyclotransferase